MTYRARTVLADCRHALRLLDEEGQPEQFRVLWVAGIALARAVGHVLRKVDASEDPALRAAVDAAYAEWKLHPDDNAIFFEFIELERNQVLKQYEVGFLDQPILAVVDGELEAISDMLFCPIADGRFVGEDCRDVLLDAIEWWERQLDAIDAAAASA